MNGKKRELIKLKRWNRTCLDTRQIQRNDTGKGRYSEVSNNMAKYKAINEQNRCVACGVCVKVCPKDAISIYKGCYAQIDEEKCIGCGICEKNCPAGVIHKVLRQPV